MQISDTSYIITFVASDNYYSTIIFDPGPDPDGKILDKFIVDFKRDNRQYVRQTTRPAIATKQYRPRKEAASFDDLYLLEK